MRHVGGPLSAELLIEEPLSARSGLRFPVVAGVIGALISGSRVNDAITPVRCYSFDIVDPCKTD